MTESDQAGQAGPWSLNKEEPECKTLEEGRMVQAAECMCKGPEAAVCWVSWRSIKKFITSGGEARGGGAGDGAGIGDQLAPAPGLVRTSSLVVSPRQGLAVLTSGLNQHSDGPDSHFEVLVALDGHCSGVGSHRGELQKFR